MDIFHIEGPPWTNRQKACVPGVVPLCPQLAPRCGLASSTSMLLWQAVDSPGYIAATCVLRSAHAEFASFQGACQCLVAWCKGKIGWSWAGCLRSICPGCFHCPNLPLLGSSPAQGCHSRELRVSGLARSCHGPERLMHRSSPWGGHLIRLWLLRVRRI